MMQIDALLQKWKEEGIELVRAEPAEVVRSAFASVGATPTDDVVALYERCGGMAEMDGNYWRLWSLKEITQENAASSETGILFGDYLINCWCYRLRPVTEEVSAVYVDHFDGNSAQLVAPSLENFLKMLVENPERVLNAAPR